MKNERIGITNPLTDLDSQPSKMHYRFAVVRQKVSALVAATTLFTGVHSGIEGAAHAIKHKPADCSTKAFNPLSWIACPSEILGFQGMQALDHGFKITQAPGPEPTPYIPSKVGDMLPVPNGQQVVA